MYGLINKAVEDLVRSKFGNDAWHRIRRKAGLPDEPFVSMEKYPDAMTYDLVAAASAELGAPAETVLEEFGRFWTVYTATGTFGEILRSVGRTLPEFLRNLDQMHTRIKLSFPKLEPPSFAVQNEGPESLDLHYFSDRPGLAPIVVGMLRGLGDRFMLDLTIVCERVQGDRPHDVFHLKWSPRA
jgi:hypothetical protein